MFKILIVDDDDMILAVIKQMLEFLGYDSILETDSCKALKLFKKNPYFFDLVIVDKSMPKMNGLELINEMWLIRPSIKFILCSGYTSAEFATDHLKDKPKIYYLQKPFNIEKLNDVMSKALPFGD